MCMKYQAFLHHFVSVGGWLEGSWDGWVGGGVGGGWVGSELVRVGGGGVGGVFMRGGVAGEGWVGVLVVGGWCVCEGWWCIEGGVVMVCWVDLYNPFRVPHTIS